MAGKGGVGKTTVTAVLARAAFLAGRRTLAVELDGKPSLAEMLPEQPTLQLSASAALAEYLDSHGLHRVARRLAGSGVIDVVANAAPGIDDIVVLGKLKQLERSGEWDTIVVDGPAAGQALTMLMAPDSLRHAVRGGPIRSQAEDVAELFADPQRCQVCLVTLPETTPVNELAETAAKIVDRVGVTLGPIVVNGVDIGPQLALDGLRAGSALRAAAEFTNERRALHAVELARAGALGYGQPIVVPMVRGAAMSADWVDATARALLDGEVDRG